MIKELKEKKEAEISFVTTKEGDKAVTEAIKFLEKQKPLKPFKFSEELSVAAKFYVSDLKASENNKIGGYTSLKP